MINSDIIRDIRQTLIDSQFELGRLRYTLQPYSWRVRYDVSRIFGGAQTLGAI